MTLLHRADVLPAVNMCQVTPVSFKCSVTCSVVLKRLYLLPQRTQLRWLMFSHLHQQTTSPHVPSFWCLQSFPSLNVRFPGGTCGTSSAAWCDWGDRCGLTAHASRSLKAPGSGTTRNRTAKMTCNRADVGLQYEQSQNVCLQRGTKFNTWVWFRASFYWVFWASQEKWSD